MGLTPQLRTGAVRPTVCGGQTRPVVAILRVGAFQDFCVVRINESCFSFFRNLSLLLTSQVNTEMKLHKFTLPLVCNKSIF